ncbi:MAG: dUTP diphosphatase [bacterium]|nr:MAG: dUTP diphosphatase [bacterium]
MPPGSEGGPVEVMCRILPHGEGLPLPEYATVMSVGMDLPAAVMRETVIDVGQRIPVPTGLAVAVPMGYEIQIRPRSGLARDHGIMIANTPGTVDPDYRGEVMVLVINLGERAFTVKRGMRIAQMVVVPTVRADLKVVEDLPGTERGEGGFGHTGVE